MVGEQIRQLRQRRHVSRAVLAKQVNISQNLLRNIEDGMMTPPIELLDRIARSLNVGMESFFEDSAVVRE